MKGSKHASDYKLERSIVGSYLQMSRDSYQLSVLMKI